jgi:hypothetical protein
MSTAVSAGASRLAGASALRDGVFLVNSGAEPYLEGGGAKGHLRGSETS